MTSGVIVMRNQNLLIWAGRAFMIVSAFFLSIIFAFMVFTCGIYAKHEGWDLWASALRAMFAPPTGTITAALFLACGLGAYLRNSKPGNQLSVRRLMTWIAVIAISLGVLAWSAKREYPIFISISREGNGQTVETKHYANFFGYTRKVVTKREN